MSCKATSLDYSETGYFSDIIVDYLNGNERLKTFYQYRPSVNALEAIIEKRSAITGNRAKLTEALNVQYTGIKSHDKVSTNIKLLAAENTFTVTTAHQPNIFTGPLYFIYKILHAIKFAAYCKEQFSQYDFVPVYYMGSEDADLDELGHIFLNGEKLNWQTAQTGAVGRMKVDKELLNLVERIESETNVLPFGVEIIDTLKEFYTEGRSIQSATLGFVNHFFGKYGLIVLIPDNPVLKSLAVDLFRDELLQPQSSVIVSKTAERLTQNGYKPQAHGRDINLFYLTDTGRNRIEKKDGLWTVLDSGISFDEPALLKELEAHPERFSPNVILRGLFQEMLLPDIAFIGGGGELAYWLELKGLFKFYKIPYPMLVLRNSFLIIDPVKAQKVAKLGFDLRDIFRSLKSLQDQWITAHSNRDITVLHALQKADLLYEELQQQAKLIDTTLLKHVISLQRKSGNRITALGKKMLRAEKRNYSDAMRQIENLKHQLFPYRNLQERIDNFIPYYAKYGENLIGVLYDHSFTLEQRFVILEQGET